MLLLFSSYSIRSTWLQAYGVHLKVANFVIVEILILFCVLHGMERKGGVVVSRLEQRVC